MLCKSLHSCLLLCGFVFHVSCVPHVGITWHLCPASPTFFFFIVFSKQKEAWNISPHAFWKCCLQNYTTALSEIKYGLRQDQRLSVFVFPSGCKILPNGNAYLFLKWKSSPLALPLTLPKRVTKKGHKWAIVLKLQLQILPVKLLKYLHHYSKVLN